MSSIFLKNKKYFYPIACLFICLQIFSISNVFGQRNINTRQNKVGILMQAIPQRYNILSNGVSNENESKNFIAIGFEVLYERVFDDYFSYGASFNYWSPSAIELTVPNSYAPDIVTLQSRSDENYTVTLSEIGVGFYGKAYLSPNRTRGIKPFLQSGIVLLNVSTGLVGNIQENNGGPTFTDNLIPLDISFNEQLIVKYIGGGATYNYRNGLGLQASARYTAGLISHEFNDKYARFYIHETLIFELGVLYGF